MSGRDSREKLVTLIARANKVIAPLELVDAPDDDGIAFPVATWNAAIQAYVQKVDAQPIHIDPQRLETLTSLVVEMENAPSARHVVPAFTLFFSALPGNDHVVISNPKRPPK